jgi:hypothetical protein
MIKLLAIVANLILAASAMGFGSLLRRLTPKTFSQLDRFILTFLGGFGLLGTILFCVGQVWFSRSAILLVLFSGVLLGGASMARAGQKVWPALRGGRLPVFPAAIVFSLLLVTAVGGLAFPVGDMSNDAIAYHYHGPKAWLREGVIRPVRDEVLTYFPVVVETQYAALMSIGGDRAPAFFAVVSLAAILLIAASLALRLGLGPTETWWAAALIATMPAVYGGVYGGFLDAVFASFVLAAARVAFDAEQPGEYALFGIFCGFAMATKYTGLIAWPLLIFCSFLISVWAYHRPPATIMKSLGIACATAIAIASPFYLRNWILYDCPIYPPPPVLTHFFTPKGLLPAVMQELLRNVRDTGRGMGGGVVNFLLLPFHLTYHTADFRGAGGIGLAALAFGPFGMVARRRDPFANSLLLFAVLQVGVWFVTAQVSRYLIHIYVIGAIFAVLGWRYAARSASRTARALSVVAIAISILYGLFIIIPARAEDMHAALSRPYEAKRIQMKTACAAGFDYINREPSVRKVLILNPGISVYFIDKAYIKPFGRWGEQTIPGATNVSEVMSQLPALHVSHIFDYKPKDGFFDLPDHPSGLTLVFEREDQRLYRVD